MIYFISGICGGLLSIGVTPNVVSVGASGAIFGLFGALIYFGYNYSLFMGLFIPGIDMWGHVGGLIGGILTANMVGTIENKKYNVSNIILLVVYMAFLIYLGIYR